MDKKLLKEALLFKNSSPPFSKVRYLFEKALHFSQENGVFFLQAERGKRANIVDKRLFFEFLSQEAGCEIRSFEHIEEILNANTRAKNIILTRNSKSSFVKIFDKTIVLYSKKDGFRLFTHLPQIDDKVVAIENAQSFLDIALIEHLFDEEYFIYLGGFGNSLTKSLLSQKDVLFFIDFDIISMNFYENYPHKKRLFIPPNIKELFKTYANEELYKKQRAYLKKSYTSQAKEIIELIKKYNRCLEQEVVNETYRSA